MSRLTDAIAQYPTFTDEKLEEYLGIWKKLYERGHKLEVTLQLDYKWPVIWLYTLTYGEERRELTYEQAWRVKDWLDSLARLT